MLKGLFTGWNGGEIPNLTLEIASNMRTDMKEMDGILPLHYLMKKMSENERAKMTSGFRQRFQGQRALRGRREGGMIFVG